jgi:hypothetical protein
MPRLRFLLSGHIQVSRSKAFREAFTTCSPGQFPDRHFTRDQNESEKRGHPRWQPMARRSRRCLFGTNSGIPPSVTPVAGQEPKTSLHNVLRYPLLITKKRRVGLCKSFVSLLAREIGGRAIRWCGKKRKGFPSVCARQGGRNLRSSQKQESLVGLRGGLFCFLDYSVNSVVQLSEQLQIFVSLEQLHLYHTFVHRS